MTIGSIIDAEPNAVCQALALKRALIETVSDAGAGAFDAKTLRLLRKEIDLEFMNNFGGGVTAHKTNRLTPGSTRVQNFNVARVEEYLADIDRQLLALGGS